jgi:hypothetical protein
MNRSRPNDLKVPGAIFVSALFLYLSTRSLFFNFDGVACAIAVDLSDFKHLVHGNHLAYGVVGWLFAQVWHALGYAGPALYPLQVLSGLLGAAAAAVFSSLLLRSGRSTREALLGGTALALSHAWWFWSLEAQVYMLGALFIALAAREALAEKPRPWLVGLWQAAAILGHVGHLMAAPAMVWALSRKPGRKTWIEYLGAMGGMLFTAYACAALLAVRPENLDQWRVWLLGSAALNADRSFGWHQIPLGSGLKSWLLVSANVLWAKGAGQFLVVFPLAAVAWGLRKGGHHSRFWGIWIISYAALFLTWEPYTIVYRITDLLAIYALAFEGLDALPARARALALAGWCAASGLHNWTAAVLPATRLEKNAGLAEAAWAGRNTPDNAWVLAVGAGPVYLPYFARRKPLNPRYWRDEAALFARLDALAATGEPVYAVDRSLAASGWAESFARYGLVETSAGAGYRLYRAERPKKSPRGR